MGAYLTIGFLVGIVMVGVYWGLPEERTGPKSFGRIVLIIIAAPFLWPVQLAFYATRYLSGAHRPVEVPAVSAKPTPRTTSTNEEDSKKSTSNPQQQCINVFRMLRDDAIGSEGGYLPEAKACSSEFIGGVLGMIDILATRANLQTNTIVETILRELFGPHYEIAMDLVQTGPDDEELMDSLEAVQGELVGIDSERKMFSVLGSIWRRYYQASDDAYSVHESATDSEIVEDEEQSDDGLLSASTPDVTKRQPVRSYKLGQYFAVIVQSPPTIGESYGTGAGSIQHVYAMAVSSATPPHAPILFVTAEQTGGVLAELMSDIGGADTSEIFLCLFDSSGHSNMGAVPNLDDLNVFAQQALALACSSLGVHEKPIQM
jgi:hypothetical protein